MEHIDTLKIYEDYLSAGYTKEQASTAARSLNGAFEGVAMKTDLIMLEKDLKSFMLYTNGGFLALIILGVTVQCILKYFNLI